MYSFIFEKELDFDRVPDVPRTGVLKAISNRSQSAFRLALEEIERRRVSEEHDWWSDDSLVFLLVLGCRLFDIESDRLGEILDIREKNSNPVPRKLNQVYRALSRGEYAMEGEYCFIKVTFLRLLGRLDLSSDDAMESLGEDDQPRSTTDCLVSQVQGFHRAALPVEGHGAGLHLQRETGPCCLIVHANRRSPPSACRG